MGTFGLGGLHRKSTWLYPVATVADLPTSAVPGSAIIVLNPSPPTPYEWNGVAWIPFPGGGGGGSGETINMVNGDTIPLTMGMPVSVMPSGLVQRAVASGNAYATRVIGLVFDASIPIGAPGQVLTDGELIASTAQWDTITGQVGGLTTQEFYFLDPSTPGKLSVAAPPSVNTGRFVVQIGQAYSPTSLEVRIQQSVLL